MKKAALIPALAAALTIAIQPAAQADTFGTSGNEFTIDFVNIGNAGNAADTTGYGAVPYEYRVGTYEITQDAISKATASGMANVTAGAWTGNQPAATISWYEAAAFVNWLNTITGNQAAYNLTFALTPACRASPAAATGRRRRTSRSRHRCDRRRHTRWPDRPRSRRFARR